MGEKKQNMRIVDDPAIAETYANKVIGISFDGGACTILLGSQRFTPERIDEAPKEGQHPKVHVTHRIALSPTAAIELINQLNRLMSILPQVEEVQQEAAHRTSH